MIPCNRMYKYLNIISLRCETYFEIYDTELQSILDLLY